MSESYIPEGLGLILADAFQIIIYETYNATHFRDFKSVKYTKK